MTKTNAPTTAARRKTTPTCPAWCVSDHTNDPAYCRDHSGRWLKNISERFKVRLTSTEHIDPADRKFDRTHIYLEGPPLVRPGVLLEPQQALVLAALFDVMGQGEVAGLLRAAVAELGEDGAK